MTLDAPVRPSTSPPDFGGTAHIRGDGRRFVLWLLVLLGLAVVVRLPFLPRLGQAYDLDSYRIWMGAIQDHGLDEVFTRTDTDYVGYHYLLWVLGVAYGDHASTVTIRDKELRLWLKVPGLAGDLVAGLLVGGVARSLARHRPRDLNPRLRQIGARLRVSGASVLGLGAAALLLFHPTVLYAGSYWGQQDLLVGCFMLAAVWLGWHRRPVAAAAVLGLGVIVKPQPLVIGPLLALLIWKRSGLVGLLRAGLSGVAVLALGHLYFVLAGNGERVLEIYLIQLQQTEHLSFSAYNLWWPAERLWGARPNTPLPVLGAVGITYGLIAMLLTVAALLWTGRHLLTRADTATDALWSVGAFLAAYYLCAGGVHERYIVPAFAFLVPVVVNAPRPRLPVMILTATTALNLLIALPMDRRWHSGDPVWLTIVLALITTVAVFRLVLTPPAEREPRGSVSAGP